MMAGIEMSRQGESRLATANGDMIKKRKSVTLMSTTSSNKQGYTSQKSIKEE